MIPPVEVGQKITEKIFAAAHDDKDAIIKVEGYIIFVPTTKAADESITVEILRVMDKFAFAVEVNNEVHNNIQ